MTHVQAYLSASKDLESRFYHCRSPVKFVHASLSTRKDLERSFNHCGSPVMLVQAYLYA